VSEHLSEARRAECDALEDLHVLRATYLQETASLREEKDAELEKLEFERTESAEHVQSLSEEVCMYVCMTICMGMHVFVCFHSILSAPPSPRELKEHVQDVAPEMPVHVYVCTYV
jgi:hypothetical protein